MIWLIAPWIGLALACGCAAWLESTLSGERAPRAQAVRRLSFSLAYSVWRESRKWDLGLDFFSFEPWDQWGMDRWTSKLVVGVERQYCVTCLGFLLLEVWTFCRTNWTLEEELGVWFGKWKLAKHSELLPTNRWQNLELRCDRNTEHTHFINSITYIDWNWT